MKRGNGDGSGAAPLEEMDLGEMRLGSGREEKKRSDEERKN